MKHVISFKNATLFKYGTVALDLSNIHLFIDSPSQTVWVDDAAAATEAFGSYGVDADEYTVNDGNPETYAQILKEAVKVARLEAQAAEIMNAKPEHFLPWE
jgi:hypothetical protein